MHTATIFYVYANVMTRLLWPLFAYVLENYGCALASTALISGQLALLGPPMILLLSIPLLTPTAPEFADDAKANRKYQIDLMKSKTNQVAVAFNAVSLFLLFRWLSPKYLLNNAGIPFFPFWSTIRNCSISLVVLDCFYYAFHSAMHMPGHHPILKWLNKVHKVHHGAEMLPLDGFRIHLVELLFTIASILSGPFLLRTHPAFTASFATFMTQNALMAHTSWLNADNGSHELHHQRSNCNFGLLGICDKLFKTTRAKSIELLWHIASFDQKRTKKISSSDLTQLKGGVSNSVRQRFFTSGETVVHYGDESSSFFILEEGSCAAFIPDPEEGSARQVMVYDEPGQFFGELSLLRNQPREATIRAGRHGAKLAEIPEEQFSVLANITSAFLEQAESYEKGTTANGIELDQSKILEYSTSIEQADFAPGEAIIHEGDQGDTMYILEEGGCSAYVLGKRVKKYDRTGDIFGELALLNDEPRKATIVADGDGATVAVVTRKVFDEMVRTNEADWHQHTDEK